MSKKIDALFPNESRKRELTVKFSADGIALSAGDKLLVAGVDALALAEACLQEGAANDGKCARWLATRSKI